MKCSYRLNTSKFCRSTAQVIVYFSVVTMEDKDSSLHILSTQYRLVLNILFSHISIVFRHDHINDKREN